MKGILRAAFTSGIGVFITLLSSAVAVKIIALVAGPAGVGLFSLLRQTQQTASVVGTFGGQSAIVQGLASKDGEHREAYAAMILRTVLIGITVVCLFIVLTAPWFAPAILGPVPNGVNLVRWLAVPTALGGGVLFLSAVINSHRAVGMLALVQVSAGLSLAVFAYAASMFAHGEGFVVLLAVSASAAFGLALYLCIRHNWLGFFKKLHAPEARHANPFLRVGGATLATGLMSMGTVLIVRSMVNRHYGLADTGIFDAAWTISMTYVMLILTSFSTHYLPTLAGLREQPEERNRLIEQYFRFGCLASLPLIASVIILKPWVVRILYSSDFLPAVRLMSWMLLGDFFKIGGWVMAMPMLAYVDMRPFVLSELAWNLAFVSIVGWMLTSGFGLDYIGTVFFGCYVVYFFYTWSYCRYRFSLHIPSGMKAAWCACFAVLAMLAFYCH